MRTPVPVAQVSSPSHGIEVQRPEDRRVDVALADDGGVQNNRDFILHYRLAGDAIESGVMLYQGRDENFFVAMVEPPAVVEAAAVLPRDYVFVVDISGSMHGFPLDTAKVLMGELLGKLRPTDSFNVLLFSGSARTLAAESVPATQANVAAAIAMLRQTAGGGGTEIVPALKRIASMPKRADVSRTVVVVTDGYVTVEREVFELVRKQLGAANVFAFGIGSSVNRHLIEGIARAGQGEAFVLTKPQFAAEQAQRFRRMVESPLMTGVSARFEGLDVQEVEPRALPDLLGNRPLVLYGKWKGDASDAKLIVEGHTAQGSYQQVVPVTGTVSRDAQALRHLWARSRIAALSDEEALQGGRAHKEQITALGLKYSLLTDYTSFIAVDRIVRNVSGDLATVDQPSPLPEGVSNLAVGAELPSTPEPATWAAVIVMLGVMAAGHAPPHLEGDAMNHALAEGRRLRRTLHWAARVDALPPWLWLALQVAALWPSLAWAARRLADGSDEPLGLVALALLAIAAASGRIACRREARLAWLAAALVLTIAATRVVVGPATAGAIGARSVRAGLRVRRLPGRRRTVAAGRRAAAAGAAGGRVAAVLRRLAAAPRHRRSQPAPARTGRARRRAPRHHARGRWSRGAGRCAVLRRAAGLVFVLRRVAPARCGTACVMRASLHACRWSASPHWPATCCATPRWCRSKPAWCDAPAWLHGAIGLAALAAVMSLVLFFMRGGRDAAHR